MPTASGSGTAWRPAPYTIEERGQIASAFSVARAALRCPRHRNRALSVALWHSQQEAAHGSFVRTQITSTDPGPAWDITRIEVECAECGDGVQAIHLG